MLDCLLIPADCIAALQRLPENSIDSLVTDPPYAWAFMGKAFDSFADNETYERWTESWARECYRVLKPGAHMLIFCGPRTYHRMASGVEDAGFEIRDQLQWLFGSGFPKSLAIDKAIDKMNGDERPVLGTVKRSDKRSGNFHGASESRPQINHAITSAASADSAAWTGWGTALKPANEPILLARKPLSEKTVAANVLKWGTGGINIDGCRVGTEAMSSGGSIPDIRSNNYENSAGKARLQTEMTMKQGRFPANLLLDEEAAKMLDEQSGNCKSAGKYKESTLNKEIGLNSVFGVGDRRPIGYSGEQGGASRFFYCAKASKSERNLGCEGLPEREKKTLNDYVKPSEGRTASKSGAPMSNNHPTVKPLRLMRYLCRLITPPNGICLDPFITGRFSVYRHRARE